MAVKICPECGGKVAMSKNVCIHCGHEFKDTKKCPECDAEVGANASTCPECGHEFTENANPSVGASVAQSNTQQNPVNTQKAVNSVVCKQCGSGDTTKIDDYTYKCNMCGTIISLPRPDTNITNINSFVGSVDDIPVYQVKQTLTEKEFVRKTVLELANKGNVSARFLESYHASSEAVKKAYITFAEVPYSVDVSYSCQIGTDYKVTYGDGKTKTETKWESFSGNGSDGGIAFMCTYGTETKIDFVTPIYYKSSNDEYIPFQEEQVYPLKRRVDRSVQESEKKSKIDELARKCKSELPGHKVDGWRYTGRCNFDPVDTFYYVPSFNLEGTSNGHSVIFAMPAIEHGHIFTYFPEGDTVVNEGGRTQPTKKTAKAEFKQHKTMFALTLVALIIGFVVTGVSIVLSSALGNFLILIASPIGLGTGISMVVIRSVITKKILNNQTLAFKNEKAEACVKCLEENQLAPLTDEEKSSIDASSMNKKVIKDKVNIIVASSLLGVSVLSLVLTAIPYGRINFGGGSHQSGSTSTQGGSTSSKEYYLSISSDNSSMGIVTDNSGYYKKGSWVEVYAQAYDGYSFTGWYEGSTKVSSNGAYTFYMPANDYSLVAKFSTNKYSLTVTSGDTSKGTVSGSGSYAYNSSVTVTATPKTGCSFTGWYEDSIKVSSNTTCTFKMPAYDYSLVAKFSTNNYSLTVTSEDTSKGTVSGSGTYAYDSSVTVTATPVEHYAFTGWYNESNKVSDDVSYTFNMPANDYSLEAKFKLDTVVYGFYPQTHVSDESLVSALNSLTASSINENGYYSYNENLYYPYVANPTEHPYYSCKFEDGTLISRGNKYWFKVEPIEWKVLDDNNEYFISSAKILDAHRHNESYDGTKLRTDYQGNTGEAYANNYKYSEVRSWLNTDFYNAAFSSDDTLIKTTEVDNSASTTFSDANKYACENTNDKVFLLSTKDLYNSSYGFDSNDSRKCKPTDFALARGVQCNLSYDVGDYWTRSPDDYYSYSDDARYACFVSDGGYPTHYDWYFVDRSCIGVRPALKLTLD
ncbi:MAG: DUF6273 domain-containing protein [Bacilli bacterium]|nr:DUF6273 domain-containing protein [Bacilli bacterium]